MDGLVVKITHRQFRQQLLGAQRSDKVRWQALNYEASLFDQFAFDDEGALWLDAGARKLQAIQEYCDLELFRLLKGGAPAPDWGAWVKKLPGYVELESMVLQ